MRNTPSSSSPIKGRRNSTQAADLVAATNRTPVAGLPYHATLAPYTLTAACPPPASYMYKAALQYMKENNLGVGYLIVSMVPREHIL